MRFRRKHSVKASEIVTCCDLGSQGVKLFRQRLGRILRACQLAFANRVHDFHLRNHTAGCPKGFEAEHHRHEHVQGIGAAQGDPEKVRLRAEADDSGCEGIAR